MSENKNGIAAAKFSKEKFLNSAAYKDRRDLIGALLEDNAEYTKAEAEKLISDYLKRKVETGTRSAGSRKRSEP